MTRVSENSARHAVNLAASKAKLKLEDLQMRGSNFKNLNKPSDDPIGNTEILALRSIKSVNDQFERNSNLAKAQLEFTEGALTDLGDIILRAKELAIQQSSEVYGGDIRKQIAEEIHQIRLQAVSIANRRFGNRYIFSGHKTLTKAFDNDGNYLGDDGKMVTEVQKDFFVPTNINGLEAFYGKDQSREKLFNPSIFDQTKMEETEEVNTEQSPNRSLAAVETQADLQSYEERYTHQERQFPSSGKSNLFHDLKSLKNALLSNSPEIIQDLLERIDDHHQHVVRTRTKIGAVLNSIRTSDNQISRDSITHEAYRTKIEDADVAELMTDLQKQQTILNATYKTGSQMLSNTLLDFLK